MPTHPIVHVEFAAGDPAASAAFYHKVFGWQLQHSADFDYHMFGAEGGPGGGFVKIDGERTKPGDVLVYIGTDDIDASLQTVEAHGGKTIVPKTEIPGIGWFGVFTDPAGNQVGLFAERPS